MHTQPSLELLTPKQDPPPSAPLPQPHQKQWGGMRRRNGCVRWGKVILDKQGMPSSSSKSCSVLFRLWASDHLNGVHPRVCSWPFLPWGGSLWVEPSTVGVRAGLLAHCTSLCIPSLFPMQIKLMRIRNIMEPIHRSSRWKMGLTTNFPLQLFCNYRGILWILMEMLSCLTASWLLFFFFLKVKKKETQTPWHKSLSIKVPRLGFSYGNLHWHWLPLWEFLIFAMVRLVTWQYHSHPLPRNQAKESVGL